jgi:hypothetical protein
MGKENEAAGRPGYRTTEFWLNLLAAVAGGAVTVGLAPAGSVWEKVMGLVLIAVAAVNQTASRTIVKGKVKEANDEEG